MIQSGTNKAKVESHCSSQTVIMADLATTQDTGLLPNANLEAWDFVVIAVYFAFILAVGIWVSNLRVLQKSLFLICKNYCMLGDVPN